MMQIVAKVFDFEISNRELERECSKLDTPAHEKSIQQALQRLIDRCLLLSQAKQRDISVTDKEYDEALLELIEQEEPFGFSSTAIQELTARELETLLRRQLIIRKYISMLCPENLPVTTEKLLDFYNEHKEFFIKPEQVHCAHILIKGTDADSRERAQKLRDGIRSKEDFFIYSQQCSDCPSKTACGDLGWFPKGKLISEIDKAAFSLDINEISQPFKSEYGYHILILLEKTQPEEIPFEDIKDSLYARMQQIEREYFLSKHLSELRDRYASEIIILDTTLSRA